MCNVHESVRLPRGQPHMNVSNVSLFWHGVFLCRSRQTTSVCPGLSRVAEEGGEGAGRGRGNEPLAGAAEADVGDGFQGAFATREVRCV